MTPTTKEHRATAITVSQTPRVRSIHAQTIHLENFVCRRPNNDCAAARTEGMDFLDFICPPVCQRPPHVGRYGCGHTRRLVQDTMGVPLSGFDVVGPSAHHGRAHGCRRTRHARRFRSTAEASRKSRGSVCGGEQRHSVHRAQGDSGATSDSKVRR